MPRPNITLNIIDPRDYRVVAEAKTDSYEHYSVSLPEGAYQVKTASAGYASRTKTVTVEKKDETRLQNVYAAEQSLVPTMRSPGAKSQADANTGARGTTLRRWQSIRSAELHDRVTTPLS